VTRRLVGDGAASVLSAVLVVKDVARPDGPEADFSGVRCDDRFVFGCGMDVRGQWRGLPALYAVAAS
jgi:hypoxanthine phosphoribosyltransferase